MTTDRKLIGRLHLLKTAIVLSMNKPASDNWRELINEVIKRLEELTRSNRMASGRDGEAD